MQYKMVMFMSRVCCHLPYGLLMAVGRVLGNLYYLLISKQRERAVAQMMPALGIDEAEARELVKESFVNLARNVLEILYMPALKNKENFSRFVEIDHLERMQEAIAEGHGVVVLTGHIGTWEWLSAAFTMNGLPVTAIAKPQPNIQYTNALDDLRKTINVQIFSRGTSELMAAARAEGKPVLIDFTGFGCVNCPMGPAVFARKFHSPVIPAFILRQPDGKHKVVIGEVMRYNDTGNPDEDLFEFTVRMTKIVEQVIRENPTQWLWFQKRWNTTPDMMKTGKHHTAVAKEERQ